MIGSMTAAFTRYRTPSCVPVSGLLCTEHPLQYIRQPDSALTIAFAVACSAFNRATCLAELPGRLQEGVAQGEEVLRLRLSIPHVPKLDIAASMNNLGVWYARLGRRGEALQMAKEGLNAGWPPAQLALTTRLRCSCNRTADAA